MFKLDDNLLIELGLGALAPTEKNRMLNHIYETLEMRVGMKLAQRMTNEQLDEFEAFIDRSDEAGALKWLEANFPNYKQVVADELQALKAEIKTAAPQIIAASQQQSMAPAVDPSQLQPASGQQYQSQQPQQQPQPMQYQQSVPQQPVQPQQLPQQPQPMPMQQPQPQQQPFQQPYQPAPSYQNPQDPSQPQQPSQNPIYPPAA